MMGRQRFHLSFDDFCKVMTVGLTPAPDAAALDAMYRERFVEGVLKYLGAEEIHSFDYSDYQGATHLHDLNQPLPQKYFGQYSTVLDFGTLQYIFYVPIAVKNFMQLVKVGGHHI